MGPGGPSLLENSRLSSPLHIQFSGQKLLLDLASSQDISFVTLDAEDEVLDALPVGIVVGSKAVLSAAYQHRGLGS